MFVKRKETLLWLIICDNQIVKNFHFCNIIFFLWFYIEFTPANSIYILLIFVPKLYSLNLFKHILIKISLLYRIFHTIIKTNLQSLLLTTKQPYQSYIDPRSKHAPSVQFFLQFFILEGWKVRAKVSNARGEGKFGFRGPKKKREEETASNEADEDTAATVIGRGVLTSGGGRAARVASCPFAARGRALWKPVAAWNESVSKRSPS